MPFDGRNYSDVGFIARAHYHPNRTLAGVVLSRNLRNAYALARNRGRVVLHKVFALEHAFLFGRYVVPAEKRIARVAHGLAPHTTHVVISVCWSEWTTLEPSFVRFRGVVYRADDTGTLDEATSTVVQGRQSTAQIEGGFGPFNVEAEDKPRSVEYEHTFAVPLANAIGEGLVGIEVYGRTEVDEAEEDPPDSVILPDTLSIWLEARG